MGRRVGTTGIADIDGERRAAPAQGGNDPAAGAVALLQCAVLCSINIAKAEGLSVSAASASGERTGRRCRANPTDTNETDNRYTYGGKCKLTHSRTPSPRGKMLGGKPFQLVNEPA